MRPKPARSRVFLRSAANYFLVVLGTVLVLQAVTTLTSAQVARPDAPRLSIDSIGARDSYEFYCAPCHGRTGIGDGPMAPALRERPADLTMLSERNGGTFPRDRLIAYITGTTRPVAAHGGPMPIWGPAFRFLDGSDVRAQVRIAAVVDHIEALQTAESGAKLFRTNCASCHGVTGRGDGPLADQMRKAIPDLTTFTRRNGGVFPSERLERIVDGRDVPSHGDREMPVWGDVFRRQTADGSAEAARARIRAITRFLQSIQERLAE